MPNFKKHSNERPNIELKTHEPPEIEQERTPLEYRTHALRQTRRMRALCQLMIKRFPLCQYDECDGRTPATQAHHIRGLSTHPELAHNEDNIAPVCDSCHAVIEGKERRGEATQEHFSGYTGRRGL